MTRDDIRRHLGAKEPDAHRGAFGATATDRLFPHPTYGAHGWVSVINPAEYSHETVAALPD